MNTNVNSPASSLPASIEIGSSLDGDATLHISVKLKEGTNVEPLIAHLNLDRDGQVYLDDLQAFMLGASAVPVESAVTVTTAVVPTIDEANVNADIKQSEVGVSTKEGVDGGPTEEKDTAHVAKLTIDDTADKKKRSFASRKEGAGGHEVVEKKVSFASREEGVGDHEASGSAALDGNLASRIDRHRQRLEIKLEKESKSDAKRAEASNDVNNGKLRGGKQTSRIDQPGVEDVENNKQAEAGNEAGPPVLFDAGECGEDSSQTSADVNAKASLNHSQRMIGVGLNQESVVNELGLPSVIINDNDMPASPSSPNNYPQNNGEISDGNDPNDDNMNMAVTAVDQWAFQQSEKEAPNFGDPEVGAVQIDEQAPQINRRFYLGLDRASMLDMRARRRQARRRRREDADVDGEAGSHQRDRPRTFLGRATFLLPRPGVESERVVGEAQRDADNRGAQESDNVQEPVRQRQSTGRRTVGNTLAGFTHMLAAVSTRFFVSAHLVEEEEEEEVHVGEVVVAERVGVFEQKWKSISCLACFLLVALAVVPAVILPQVFKGGEKEEYTSETVASTPSSIPSMQPSTSPSFDPRPTLEVVQARKHVRCLMFSGEVNPTEKERIELCRSIAAVLFGDPENYRVSTSKWSDAFGQLNSRNTDVMIRSVTHTVEREVRETSTGVGFSFSSPYYYDGMAYFGNETFVRCAEEKRRYNECSSLRICVPSFTTIFDFVQSSFPSNFLKVFSSEQTDELMEMVWNGTCVRAQDRSLLLPYASSGENSDKNYIVGDKLMTKEPHAIVTRNDDREFSDIINWVVHALYYGQEQGMTNSSSLCQSYANLTLTVADLNLLNAVHCVGNLGQVMSNIVQYSNGMNKVNNGTTGMLYATPFGELGHAHDDIATGGLLDDIRNDQGSLKCGVVVPDGITRYIAESDQLVGMSIDYCRTIAAALFDVNFEAVKLLNFSDTDSSSFDALNNGTIDVLAGARVELKYDFESSPSLGGFQFSTPYYYGNETARDDVSSFSLATREDDVLFSSFVNTIVLTTLHAQEISITRERSSEMPSMSTFGSEFNWALRDAISYSGSYGEMYSKNFGDVLEEDRGRNSVNNKGGPQIHSFPGLNVAS